MGSIVLMLIIGLLALFIGAIPAMIAFFMTETWWVALIVGMVVFSILFIVPMIFVKGLYLIFRSAIWTLTFRELTFATPHPLELDLPDESEEKI
jgi:hypothetical protein